MAKVKVGDKVRTALIEETMMVVRLSPDGVVATLVREDEGGKLHTIACNVGVLTLVEVAGG